MGGMHDLFILAKHETELYEYLVDHFRQDPCTQVILDRRREPDRLGESSRRRMSSVDRDLSELGFAVVRSTRPCPELPGFGRR